MLTVFAMHAGFMCDVVILGIANNSRCTFDIQQGRTARCLSWYVHRVPEQTKADFGSRGTHTDVWGFARKPLCCTLQAVTCPTMASAPIRSWGYDETVAVSSDKHPSSLAVADLAPVPQL